jgi:N-acetylglucosamine-6-sulfatase
MLRALIAASFTALIATSALGQPNIVVIMTDDQDDMGSLKTMPNVKALIRDQGVTFTNSFAVFPLCGPARVSFLTGQYPHNHGARDNASAYSVFRAREGNSLGPWLQAAGYKTAYIGKTVNGYDLSSADHVMPGWNEFDAITEYTYFNYTLLENGAAHSYGSTPEDYVTDVLARKATDFISAQADPFFLLFTPFAPHRVSNTPVVFAEPAPRHKGVFANLPMPINKSFNEFDVSDKPGIINRQPLMTGVDKAFMESEFRARRESLLAVDDAVGSIVSALGDKIDNTIIVFTSDNGWSQGQHRWVTKELVYEEPIRVPLAIRWPGMPAGETRDQLVSNLDLVATILTEAGATAGNTLDGLSLRPIIEDGSRAWRTVMPIEGCHRSCDQFGYFAARSRNYIYSETTSKAFGFETELYDLAQDPLELANRLARSHNRYRKVVKFMRALLSATRSCAGSSCWITDPVPVAEQKATSATALH